MHSNLIGLKSGWIFTNHLINTKKIRPKMSNPSEDHDSSNIVEQPSEEGVENISIDAKTSSIIAGVIRREIRAIEFSGPLPHPKILEGYERVLPGSADRILSMAENEGEHRRTIEKTIVKTDIIRSYLGLGSGFIIALVGLGGSIYLAMNDKPVASGIMSAGTVTGLVAVFVVGEKPRKAQIDNIDDKSEEE
jgi:uncharacterized membrane protein